MERKNIILFYPLAIIGMFLMITNSCKKDDEISNTVKDFDGNTYHTITIGTQVWMMENLKVTHFNNGDSIPNVTNNTAWNNMTSPGYCWYNNSEPTYKNTYGALYNWYTINTGKLCPSGWHVPSDSEWTILITFLGGDSIAGGKIKEAGSVHWLTPNTGATNSSGFSALPGGGRGNGTFNNINAHGSWWSSTEASVSNAWRRLLYSDSSDVFRDNNPKYVGHSVRCVKN